MGIYNNYSGYYKARRKLYVNERSVKLTLPRETIRKKMGLTKYGDFPCLEYCLEIWHETEYKSKKNFSIL